MHYLPSAMNFLIYLVAIPILVFFFNYDYTLFGNKIRELYPDQAPDLEIIARDIGDQLRYYVRGKIVHMSIIGGVSFILFLSFSLHYALILAVAMGFSVFIPFVGTALATLPLALISYAQFGLTGPLFYILGGHSLIHLWNENILVPMIFSKSNDMHPLTILSSVLIFGHLMGILGVFLAIPLTAIIKICILRWPSEKISAIQKKY
jgi:putative permease